MQVKIFTNTVGANRIITDCLVHFRTDSTDENTLTDPKSLIISSLPLGGQYKIDSMYIQPRATANATGASVLHTTLIRSLTATTERLVSLDTTFADISLKAVSTTDTPIEVSAANLTAVGKLRNNLLEEYIADDDDKMSTFFLKFTFEKGTLTKNQDIFINISVSTPSTIGFLNVVN